MLGNSIRYILIVSFLAFFVAVFISSHESELSFENLVKKRKNANQAAITIKKPTTNKSNVGKVGVKTQFSISAKAAKSGGNYNFFNIPVKVSAQGKTTASTSQGKATMSVKIDGKSPTSMTHSTGKITLTIDSSGKARTSVDHSGKITIMNDGRVPSGMIPSGMSTKTSISSISHSAILPNGPNIGTIGKKADSSQESGKNQPILPKNITGSYSINMVNQTGDVYYYPYPNELNFPQNTVFLSNGSLILPNRTMITQLELGQMLIVRALDNKKESFTKEEITKQSQYGIVKYPQPNNYGFPEGTRICGNGSILFTNGTQLSPIQFGQKANTWIQQNGVKIPNASHLGFPEGAVRFPNQTFKFPNGTFFNAAMSFVKIPFPNDLGLPEGTKYFSGNLSYVLPNGAVVTSKNLPSNIPQTPVKAEKYFLVPNPYNFPNISVLYSNGSVVFPNKTILSKTEYQTIYNNTPIPINMPNSFGFSNDTLIYQNGSSIIQNGKKVDLNETIARQVRVEMKVFSKACYWPYPNVEGFPQGTRLLYNDSILLPNNTYYQKMSEAQLLTNPTLQKLRQDLMNPQDPSIQAKPLIPPQSYNSTMKLDVGISGQGNVITASNSTSVEGKASVIVNAKQNRRFIIL